MNLNDIVRAGYETLLASPHGSERERDMIEGKYQQILKRPSEEFDLEEEGTDAEEDFDAEEEELDE